MPYIAQAIVAASPDIRDQDHFERKILTIRKQILNRVVAMSERLDMPALRDLFPRPLDMFAFIDGDPARTRRMMDRGILPWWTFEDARLAFWRPADFPRAAVENFGERTERRFVVDAAGRIVRRVDDDHPRLRADRRFVVTSG